MALPSPEAGCGWRISSATRRFLTVRVVKGHRLVLVAASMLKLGAA